MHLHDSLGLSWRERHKKCEVGNLKGKYIDLTLNQQSFKQSTEIMFNNTLCQVAGVGVVK